VWWRREHATIVGEHCSVDGWVSSMLIASQTTCNRWSDSCGATYSRAVVAARITTMGGAIVSSTGAAVRVDGRREERS
jgi:hypothetical protein